MSIATSEMKFYKAKTVTDTSANGGLMSKNTYTSNVVQNVFPNVLSAERASGSIKYRKIFCKVDNDADETLFAPNLYLFAPTAGDDWVTFFIGTQTDIQSDITGSERKYGAGTLVNAVTASATVLVINVEDSSITGIYQANDKIYITDKLTPSATTGNEETATILSVDSVSGTQISVTLSSGLTAGYAAGSTVSSVYVGSDLACSVTNWVETGAFTYDEATYPVACDNIGTVEETWTLTFTSATTFTVSGAGVGSVGAGTISSDFAPINADFSKPFLTLLSAGWGGTAVAGNTLVFKTHPASTPIWEKRVVPAGASSMAGNNVYLCWSGETV